MEIERCQSQGPAMPCCLEPFESILAEINTKHPSQEIPIEANLQGNTVAVASRKE